MSQFLNCLSTILYKILMFSCGSSSDVHNKMPLELSSEGNSETERKWVQEIYKMYILTCTLILSSCNLVCLSFTLFPHVAFFHYFLIYVKDSATCRWHKISLWDRRETGKELPLHNFFQNCPATLCRQDMLAQISERWKAAEGLT